MLADVVEKAKAQAEELEKQYDQAFKGWQSEARTAFTELLKSDQATKLREFIATASWLYKAGGGNRYHKLTDDSAMQHLFDVSDDVAESLAKKAGVFTDRPAGDWDLIDQLKELASGVVLQPAYATPEPRPMAVRHVRASEEDRAAVREKIKSQKGIPTYAGPPVGGNAA